MFYHSTDFKVKDLKLHKLEIIFKLKLNGTDKFFLSIASTIVDIANSQV